VNGPREAVRSLINRRRNSLRPLFVVIVAMVCASILTGLAVIAPTRALASGTFHAYSDGFDTVSRTGNNYYSGVSVQRYDENMSLSANSDCTDDYTAPVANQSQWVAMNSSGSQFLELGTADVTCSGGGTLKYWYAYMSNPNGFQGISLETSNH
jgi:hypothetical protein